MNIDIIKSGRGFFWAGLLGCFMLGIISAFAMAPANYVLALFMGLSLLYILLAKTSSALHAFGFGWAFGFGYFLISLSWIGNALLVEGNPYAWAWPLAVTGLPVLLAFFPALACMGARRFSNLQNLSGLLSFIGFMALSEWLRGHVFTGFPWNLYGYSWVDFLPIVQIASIGNVYFLTFLTIFWATLPGFIYVSSQSQKAKVTTALCAALAFGACFAYGSWRLSTYETEYVDDISIRIVQPNIAQKDKWNRQKMVNNFYKQVDLSYGDGSEEKTTYIIWPETALNYWFTEDKSSMLALQNSLRSYPNKAYLLAGVLRNVAETKSYFNSMVLINDQGEFLQTYDKSHLVPFGEYIPFQKWVPFGPVSQFTGMTAGKTIQSFTTPEGMNYNPLICYEVIFPGQIIDRETETPDVIINATNDAWYGFSAGPHQHFVHAIFRAVEEGIPVVRAANTGISGLVDPLGRVLYKTKLFEDSAKSFLLPTKIMVFKLGSFFENAIFLVLMLAFGLSGALKNRYYANNN